MVVTISLQDTIYQYNSIIEFTSGDIVPLMNHGIIYNSLVLNCHLGIDDNLSYMDDMYLDAMRFIHDRMKTK